MALVVHDLVAVNCIGSVEGCRATSDSVYEEIVALQGDPPAICCSTRTLLSREIAEDQIIDYELFRPIVRDQFPYLCIQVRYDPNQHNSAELEPIFERFGLVTVDRWENDRLSFVM